ncbi:hypothetical protein ACVRZR_01800 [Streptococcus entericus]|uniref:hypothetical protein n=1 Tax=Streptococcus entericus TaxID=155680 RepID=UPI000365423C|nr:hypothetical protein [Streptococcus entericus]
MTFLVKLLISLVAFLISFGVIFGLFRLSYTFLPYLSVIFLGTLLANLGRRLYTHHLESKKK